MSPVIRKWGMRGVVTLCIGAFALSGTVLYVGVFAATTVAAPALAQAITDPQTWSQLVERHGVATVILGVVFGMIVVAGFYVRKGVIAVWEFSKPLAEGVVGDYRAMTREQGEFAKNANTLLTKSVKVDEDNGQIIHQTFGLVKEIHGEIVK